MPERSLEELLRTAEREGWSKQQFVASARVNGYIDQEIEQAWGTRGDSSRFRPVFEQAGLQDPGPPNAFSGGTTGAPGSTEPTPTPPSAVPGAPATPEIPPAPTMDFGAVEGYIASNYPQFAWLINNTEMRDLFRRAMDKQYPASRFEVELQKTQWWQERSVQMRTWEAKKATDPQEAERLFQQWRGYLADQAARLGADLDPRSLAQLTENALLFGWNENEISDALVNHVSFVEPTGISAGAMQLAGRLESEYAIPVTEAQKQEWARAYLTGEATEESLQAEAIERAKSLWDPDGTTISRGLDAGFSVRQLMDGYIQLAAKELEIDPQSIDISETKWSRPLMQVDPDSGQRAQMSLYDWQQTLRSDDAYGWKHTKAAEDEAAQMELGLLRTFGAIA